LKGARERPVRIVEDAIFGMLRKPSSQTDDQKTPVYAGDKHPHAAQKPVALP